METSILDPEPQEISLAAAPQPAKITHWFTPSPQTFLNYKLCPYARTNICRDNETDGLVAFATTCKRWGCEYCAPRKIRKLAFLTNNAKPNRWIRLGVRPNQYDSAGETWKTTSPLVPELFRRLRNADPKGEYEYLRVCEIHTADKKYGDYGAEAKGFPHYHALLRCPFIHQRKLGDAWASLTAPPYPTEEAFETAIADQQRRSTNLGPILSATANYGHGSKEARAAWTKQTGAGVVWIAKVDKGFSSVRYLTKYLTKLHRIEWTDRHVSFSKGFFRPEDLEKIAYANRVVIKREEDHPWKYLADYFPDETIAVDDKGGWHIPRLPYERVHNHPLSDFGLRPPTTPDCPNPPTQTQLTAFDTLDPDTWEDQSF